MSPPCSKLVAGNRLRGRYLARVWRVLVQKASRTWRRAAPAGSHQAAVAWFDRAGPVRGEWLAPTARRALLAQSVSEPSREEHCHDCHQPGRP
jgi:hypothetical protein